MSLEIPDGRSCSDELLEALRRRAIHAHQAGYTQTTIADILGVRQETVSHWCTAFERAGPDSLRVRPAGHPVGTGRRLTPVQEDAALEAVLNETPTAHGIAASLWTRAAVRALICQQTGVELPVRTVGEYLKRWGFTAQRPLRHAYRQDPEAVQRWLVEEYPKIQARAKREGAEIHWGDEMGVDADRSPARGYAPRGQTPARQVTGGHVRVNVVSTVTNTGKLRFKVYTETMTGALFVTFLKQLVAGADTKIFLIVDRLQAHVGAEATAWLQAHAEQIEVFPLPAYAPELNPDEYLNHDVKATVNESGPATSKTRLTENLRRLLHRLAQLPAHVASYFEHPQVAYAAAQ
jgi:transposase